MHSHGNTVYLILMYQNLDFLVKSATVVDVLLFSALMLLFFFRQKIVAVLGQNKNNKASSSCDSVVPTVPYVYSLYFSEKKELSLKTNKSMSCIFAIAQKVIKVLQNHNKNKSGLVKALLDYNILYYRVANYKCNRLETRS